MSKTWAKLIFQAKKYWETALKLKSLHPLSLLIPWSHAFMCDAKKIQKGDRKHISPCVLQTYNAYKASLRIARKIQENTQHITSLYTHPKKEDIKKKHTKSGERERMRSRKTSSPSLLVHERSMGHARKLVYTAPWVLRKEKERVKKRLFPQTLSPLHFQSQKRGQSVRSSRPSRPGRSNKRSTRKRLKS